MSKTATIATKITTETLAALEAMAARRGTSVYELVLSSVLMLLRLGSKKIAMSDTVMRNWHAFEHEYGSLSAANLATLKQQDLTIQDAIYRVTQKGKKDATLIYMARPFFGEAKVSQNNEDIVDLVLRTAYPSTYRMLEEIKTENRLNSVMGAISYLIHEYHGNCIEREIEDLFSDNARAENNRDLRDQQPMKRKHHKGIDERQTTMTFDAMDYDDEQGQELPQTDRQHTMGEAFAEDEGI